MDKAEGRFAQFQLFISAAFDVHTGNAARDQQGYVASNPRRNLLDLILVLVAFPATRLHLMGGHHLF